MAQMRRAWSRAGLAALALAVMAVGGRAQSAGDAGKSPLHALARAVGLAAEPPPPADFVRENRPTEPTKEIPVFSKPVEPTSSVRSPTSLKSMDSELDAAAKAHAKLRAANGEPPAGAAEARAKKSKAGAALDN